MILIKSQVHLPQHKIGLIEFQTLHLFCRAEMLSSLLLFKTGLSLFIMIYIYIIHFIYMLFNIYIIINTHTHICKIVAPLYLWGILAKTPRGCLKLGQH